MDILLAQAYADGYYDGRVEGQEQDAYHDDELRHWYRLGYERGVADYCRIELEELENEEC